MSSTDCGRTLVLVCSYRPRMPKHCPMRTHHRKNATHQIIHAAHLTLRLVERDTDGGASGRNVLEARRRGQAESLRELPDERVRVKRVEEVDVAGGAAEGCMSHSISIVTPVVRLIGRERKHNSPLNGNSPSVTNACAGFWCGFAP